MRAFIARETRVSQAARRQAPNNNVKKLTGVEGYRLRVGDWRVIYTLKRQILTIIVITPGHRSEVYE